MTLNNDSRRIFVLYYTIIAITARTVLNYVGLRLIINTIIKFLGISHG